MDDYIDEMQSTLVRGIAIKRWQRFFKDRVPPLAGALD